MTKALKILIATLAICVVLVDSTSRGLRGSRIRRPGRGHNVSRRDYNSQNFSRDNRHRKRQGTYKSSIAAAAADRAPGKNSSKKLRRHKNSKNYADEFDVPPVAKAKVKFSSKASKTKEETAPEDNDAQIEPFCPQVSEGTCLDDDEEGGPVYCGACEYQSKCHSQENQGPCFSYRARPDCPRYPPDEEECLGEPRDPYRCGDCTYENLCHSQAFITMGPSSDIRCEPECPIAINFAACDNDEPVVCGSCKYNNICEAAGYQGDIKCVPDIDKADTDKECPVDADLRCTKEFKPVVCGDCEYNNKCFAQVYPNPADCRPKCPENPNLICPLDYNPVVCGDCEYSNRCFAQAYPSQGDCQLKCPETEDKCDDQVEGIHYMCGECYYPSLCAAKEYTDLSQCRQIRDISNEEVISQPIPEPIPELPPLIGEIPLEERPSDPIPVRPPLIGGGMQAPDLLPVPHNDTRYYPNIMCYDKRSDSCIGVSNCNECAEGTMCTNDVTYECGKRACKSIDIEGANRNNCDPADCNSDSGCASGYKCIALFASKYTNYEGCIAYEGY